MRRRSAMQLFHPHVLRKKSASSGRMTNSTAEAQRTQRVHRNPFSELLICNVMKYHHDFHLCNCFLSVLCVSAVKEERPLRYHIRAVKKLHGDDPTKPQQPQDIRPYRRGQFHTPTLFQSKPISSSPAVPLPCRFGRGPRRQS